jgi:hypothetical protein
LTHEIHGLRAVDPALRARAHSYDPKESTMSNDTRLQPQSPSARSSRFPAHDPATSAATATLQEMLRLGCTERKLRDAVAMAGAVADDVRVPLGRG